MKLHGTITFQTNNLIANSDKLFDKVSSKLTVDDLYCYHAYITIPLRGTMVKIPIRFKPDSYHSKCKILFEVSMNKALFTSITTGVLLGSLFGLVQPAWYALIFGVISGAFMFILFLNGIRYGLWRFENHLRDKINTSRL